MIQALELKEFDNCICAWQGEYVIEVYDLAENYLGTIQGTDPNEDWKLIKEGHNPINERWEDGAGNTCTLEGWDEYYRPN